MKNNELSRKCGYCGIFIVGAMSKKYCSDKCKVYAYRARHGVQLLQKISDIQNGKMYQEPGWVFSIFEGLILGGLTLFALIGFWDLFTMAVPVWGFICWLYNQKANNQL